MNKWLSEQNKKLRKSVGENNQILIFIYEPGAKPDTSGL